MRVNRAVEGVDEDSALLRPDLVVRDDHNQRITIVDVATSFETCKVAFDDARAEILEKYSGQAKHPRRQGYEVIVDAFVVDALIGWNPLNERTMRLLNLVPEYLRRACIGGEKILESYTRTLHLIIARFLLLMYNYNYTLYTGTHNLTTFCFSYVMSHFR